MLLQNGGEVGLGHVVRKGAVAEHAGCVAGRDEFFVPSHDALRQGFHLVAADCRREAGHQHTAANRMHAALLRMAPGTPLLRMRFVPYDMAGRPLLFAEVYFHPDKFSYRAVIRR